MKMKNKYGSLFGNKGTLWANMGFSKSLFNERGKISFNVDNIFKPRFFYGVGDGNGDFLRKINSKNSIFKRSKEFKKRLNLT